MCLCIWLKKKHKMFIQRTTWPSLWYGLYTLLLCLIITSLISSSIPNLTNFISKCHRPNTPVGLYFYLFIYFYFCYIFKEYLNQLNISAILNYRAQKGTISLQLKIQGRRYISRLSNWHLLAEWMFTVLLLGYTLTNSLHQGPNTHSEGSYLKLCIIRSVEMWKFHISYEVSATVVRQKQIWEFIRFVLRAAILHTLTNSFLCAVSVLFFFALTQCSKYAQLAVVSQDPSVLNRDALCWTVQ